MFSGVSGVPARFAGQSKDGWQAALQATARVGLLTPLGGGQYGVHPALPAYLAAQWRAEAGAGFEDERQAAQRALLSAYAGFGGWLISRSERLGGDGAGAARAAAADDGAAAGTGARRRHRPPAR